jgi:SAM-dependent methyltransferase
MRHYQDQDALRQATDACVQNGMRVLQLYRCGDEPSHVARLLALMAPPADAVVVDVGCGIGEVARLMQELRTDLSFLLLNLSAHQLELCPNSMRKLQADMHAMPLADCCADVVMVNYTLGYAALAPFMAEAARVLKPGGVLFIYDLSARADDGEPCRLMLDKFSYQVFTPATVCHAAQDADLALDAQHFLPATPDHLDPLLDDDYRAVMAQLETAVQPTAWRFMKEPA